MDVRLLALKPDVTLSIANRAADVISGYDEAAELAKAREYKSAVILAENRSKEVNL